MEMATQIGLSMAVPALTGGSASSSMGMMDVLSNGLNLGQAAFSLFGANKDANSVNSAAQQQARALELASKETLLTAHQEEIRGKQDTNNIMDQMIQTIASQRLSSAANGVDIGFGTPVLTEKSTRKLAEMQIKTGKTDTQIQSLARRRQAAAQQEDAMNTRAAGRDKASAIKLTSYGDAISTVGKKVMRGIERG